jgi:putative hydrolase of the HAD superfamily
VAARKTLTDRWGKPLRAEVVFFDVGGTLVCSDLGHLDLLHQALLVIGYRLTRDEVVEANEHARRAVARRRRRLVSRMDTSEASRMWLEHLAEALELGIQGPDLEVELTWAIREIETGGEVAVDPDAPRLLENLLARGLRLGVISNWSADLPQYLADRDLAKYFETIIASDAVGTSKPHREIFLRGLAAMGCSPHEAVHVGDDYWADVVGARDLGMGAVLVDRDREAVHSDCPTIARLRDLESLV